MGHRDEAIASLRQVQADFVVHRLPADSALATLELAVLLLEDGRTGEVRELSVEMLPIFASLHFGEEALAALRLFWEAAEQERATAEALAVACSPTSSALATILTSALSAGQPERPPVRSGSRPGLIIGVENGVVYGRAQTREIRQ